MADQTTHSGEYAGDVRQRASGKITLGADAIVATDHLRVVTGFKPRYVQFVNATDRVTVEWYEGMDDNTCLKTAAAGTRTLETTNGGITVDDRGFRVLQNATLAAVLASKTCYWIAEG